MRWLILVLGAFLALPGWAGDWSRKTLEPGQVSFYEWTTVDDSEALNATRCGTVAFSYADDVEGSDTAASATVVTCERGGTPIGSCTSAAAFTTDTATPTLVRPGGFHKVDVGAAPTTGTARVAAYCAEQVSSSGGGGGVEANTPTDTDGDGSADFILVDGDYNGDGLIDTEDLFDAQHALPDTGRTVMQVKGPRDYPAPAGEDPTSFYNSAKGGSSRSLLDALENQTIVLEPGVRILNWAHTVAPSESMSLLRAESGGETGFRLIGGEFDGGFPTTSTDLTANTGARMGLNLSDLDDWEVHGTVVRNTGHSGLYVAESIDGTAYGLQCYDVGGYHGSNAANTGQPCMYAFAHSGGITTDISCVGCESYRSGSAAFNTRRDDTTATIGRISFIDFYAEDTQVPNSVNSPSTCVALRGTFDSVARGGVCRRTRGISVGSGTTGYADVNASQRAVFENITAYENIGTGNFGQRSTNALIRNVQYLAPATTGSHGLVITPPHRGLQIQGLTIEAAGAGIHFDMGNGAAPTVGDERERISIQGKILGTDFQSLTDTTYYPGVLIDGGKTLWGVDLDLDVQGVTFQGLRTLSGTAVRGFRISGHWDGVRRGFEGATTVAAAASACGAALEGHWWRVTDATGATDCTTGGGATSNKCRCVSSALVDLTNEQGFRPGILLANGNDIDIDVDVSNWEGDAGVYLQDTAGAGNIRVHRAHAYHNADDEVAGTKQTAAVFPSGTTNLSGISVMPLPTCSADITGNCLNLSSANASIFVAGQEFVQTASPGTCVDGQLWKDTDGGAGAVLNVCESATFVGK